MMRRTALRGGPDRRPDYRRRGIATALVSEVAARCSQWGFDSLALRLDTRHGGARELYSVLGFEEIA